MTPPTCATCRFYEERGKQCRRHAPILVRRVMFSDTTWGEEATWPRVWESAWCGEHAPKGGGELDFGTPP